MTELRDPALPPAADVGSFAGQGISVIIPAYADRPRLHRAVRSVETTTDLPFELVVALAPQQVAANRNAGLARATQDLCAFLDDDVVLPPGWASRLVAVLDARPDVGAVSGKLVFPDGRPQTRRPDLGPGELWEIPIPGTCFVYCRSRVGDPYFDQTYLGSQWEDTDWVWQLRERGFPTVMTGDVTVVHDHQLSENQWFFENAERFQRKWGRFPAEHEVAAITREELDATDPPAVG